MGEAEVTRDPMEGFERVPSRTGEVWVRAEARAWAQRALDAGLTLFQAARGESGALVLEGRGPVYVVPAPPAPSSQGCATATGSGSEPPPRWVVRHYHRGGWLAPLLGDRYLRLGVARPLRELLSSEAVRSRGVSTPRVVAAAVYRGAIFTRGDIVTEYVSRSEDLAQVIFGEKRQGLGGAVDRREALIAAGELIRTLAEAGVSHPDLNAKNVLMEWMGAAPQAHLLDLDRCKVMGEDIHLRPDGMHERLRRSLRKWERRMGVQLAENEWRFLEDAVRGSR